MLVYEVKSSDGTGSYSVKIEGAPGFVRMFCTCAAGENGSYCKHRFSLLDGDVSAVISGDTAGLSDLREWLRGSRLEAAFNEAVRAEKAADAAKKALTKAKAAVARAMREG